MKNKKLLITVLMFSILLTMIFPISAFATDTYTIEAGTYTFNDEIEIIDGYSFPLNFTFNAQFSIDDSTSTLLSADEGYSASSIELSLQDDGIGVMNYTYSVGDLQNVSLPFYCSEDGIGFDIYYYTYQEYTNSYLARNLGKTITVTKDTVCGVDQYTWFTSNTDYFNRQPSLDNTPTLNPLKAYGGITLTDIDTVWTNKDDYKVAIIFKDKNALNYHLILGYEFDKDYIYTDTTLSGSPETYCRISSWQWYDYVPNDNGGTEVTADWVYNTGATNDVICRTETYDLIWSSAPIYTDSTRDEYFFHITPLPTGVLTTTLTGVGMAGVMKEILVILPITILCLIGYLTLRKGLAVLQHLLRTA